MRFFLEPIVLTINYAMSVLGYQQVHMMGLSGGGWSTTIAAAIDPRITLSMPTAGSIPCEFKHTSWDWEQYGACGWDGAKKWPANYTEMYISIRCFVHERRRFAPVVVSGGVALDRVCARVAGT